MRNTMDVKVWGPWACFTRPEMKVERVSYDVMTPSAARGVLEAIFWKPEFFWRVREIRVLRPVRHFSLTRNETKSVVKDNAFTRPYYADDDSTPRHTLALRDVAYIIRASVHVLEDVDEYHRKYEEQFIRRAKKGQYFHHPYLGCREFAADFAPPDGSEKPVGVTTDLGRMMFDFTYSEEERETAIFFDAKLEDGVMKVPQSKYQRMEVSVC